MDVVIYSEGRPYYLKWCLESIRVHSPGSRVMLLGNELGELPHYDSKDYLKRFEEFEPHYEHHSPNPRYFEIRCIRRWFAICEFVRTTDMTEFICIDSDVMTFCDYGSLIQEAKQSPLWSPHASVVWVFDRHGLEEFCDYIMDVYVHKDGPEWQRMLSDFNEHRCAVIGDMNLIEGFMRDRPHLNFCDAKTRDNVIDGNICVTRGFMADGDRKRIFFWDGFPYAMTDRRTVVRMNSLHCWGPYKPRMEEIWNLSRRSVGNPAPVPWI